MAFIKKLFVLFFLMSANASYGFVLYGQCIANPSVATCFISNNLPRPIVCEVLVTGISAYGNTAFVNNLFVIYPFSWREAYIFSFNPYVDPLVSASYFANCRY